MERHPIESLMSTTMENIRDMVDVNTVIGEPVRTDDGITIIPISRVGFGFVAGGGEYAVDNKAPIPQPSTQGEELPFAGGSGAGVSVHPMGFLVVGNGQVKLLSANYITPVDRVMELLPQVIGDLKQILGDAGQESKPNGSAKSAPEAAAPIPTTPLGGAGGYDPLAGLSGM